MRGPCMHKKGMPESKLDKIVAEAPVFIMTRSASRRGRDCYTYRVVRYWRYT